MLVGNLVRLVHNHPTPPLFDPVHVAGVAVVGQFPVMSVVKLRIEIERALREVTVAKGVAANRPGGIMNMLQDLQRRGIAPASTQEMLGALRVMNEASHGVDVDADAAKQAVDVGIVFLAELRKMDTGTDTPGE